MHASEITALGPGSFTFDIGWHGSKEGGGKRPLSRDGEEEVDVGGDSKKRNLHGRSMRGVVHIKTCEVEELLVQLRISNRVQVYRRGKFSTEGAAALVRDYMVRRLHEVYGMRSRPLNFPDASLQSGSEMKEADRSLEDIFLELSGAANRDDTIFLGVRPLTEPGLRPRFQVCVRLKGKDHLFGDYGDDVTAALAYDYDVSELVRMHCLSPQQLNSQQYGLKNCRILINGSKFSWKM